MNKQILEAILQRKRRESHYLETCSVGRNLPKHDFPTIITGFIDSNGRARPNSLASELVKKGINLDLSDIAVKYFDGSECKGSIENIDCDKMISSLAIHTSKKYKSKYFEFEIHLNESLDKNFNLPLAKYTVSYYGNKKNEGLVSEVEDCIRQIYQKG